MGKSKKNTIADVEVPKRRGRAAGAKTYNKKTLYKLVKQFKPTNMVLWGIIAEQYRVACGELEARPAAVIKKFFVTKMCNSMRKPTGSSGIDDMTAKSQSLQRPLHQIEIGDTFGDEMEEGEVSEEVSEASVSDSDSEDWFRTFLIVLTSSKLNFGCHPISNSNSINSIELYSIVPKEIITRSDMSIKQALDMV